MGFLHATGQVLERLCNWARWSTGSQGLNWIYLIDRGATAVSQPALMRVIIMGFELAPYEPTEPYASRHAGQPNSIAADCYTAARRPGWGMLRYVIGMLCSWRGHMCSHRHIVGVDHGYFSVLLERLYTSIARLRPAQGRILRPVDHAAASHGPSSCQRTQIWQRGICLTGDSFSLYQTGNCADANPVWPGTQCKSGRSCA